MKPEERFEIGRKLGEGASAVVYLARDRLRLGLPVALKLLRDTEQSARLATELEVLAPLRHPNLAAIYDAELTGDQPFLSVEYVEGPDLTSWARQQSQLRILTTLAGVLRALCLLHDRGWLHGDLKPQNILCDVRGQAKLVDLGLACRPGRPDGGTPGYLAPELVQGGASSVQADLYSFGVLALEALGGERIFSSDPAAALEEQLQGRPRIPSTGLDPRVEELLRSCLAVRPAERPPGAAQLLRALEERSGLDLSPELAGDEALPQPVLSGRDEVVELARQALQRGASGEGPTVLLLEGAAGLGKTRLLAEIRIMALRLGHACTIGTSLRGALAALLGGHGQGEATPARAAAVAAGVLPGVLRTELVGVGSETRLRAALFAVLEECTGQRPMALLLDQAEGWSGDEVGALDGLARALEDLDPRITKIPLLFAVASRRALPITGRIERALLQPLDDEASKALLRSMLAGVNFEDALPGLAQMGAGLPWLLEETLRLWLRSGRRFAAEMSSYPDRVRELARQRLCGLGAEERRALLGLALADELTRPALHHLSPGLDEARLRALLDARLVQERGVHLDLRLALGGEHLRQELLGTLTEAERRDLHRELGGVLRQTGAAAVEVARQLELAGQSLEAAELYLEAVQDAELAEAADLARRAISLAGPDWPRWGQALRCAADAEARTGDLGGAASQLEQLFAAGQAEDADRLALAGLLASLGQAERAQALLDGLTGTEASLARARVLLLRRQPDQVQALCQQLPESGAAANLCGLAHYARGELGPARTALQRAEGLFAAENDAVGLVKVANNLGLVQQALGDLSAAQRSYRLAGERARMVGDQIRAVHCQLNHGTVCQLAGSMDEALRDYQQAILDARRLGDTPLADQARMNLCTLLLELGDAQAARGELDRCAPAQPRLSRYALLYRAELAIAAEDPPAAEELVQQVLSACAVEDDPNLEVEAQLTAARVALAGGRAQRAAEIAEQGGAAAAKAGFSRLLDEARLLQGRAMRRLPQADLAKLRELLGEVVLHMEARGEFGRLWQACYELHIVEAMLGLQLEAGFHLAKTRQLLDALVESVSVARRATLLSRPDLREAYAASRAAAGAVVSSSPASVNAEPRFDAEALLRLNLELSRLRDPEQLLTLILDKAIELSGAQRGLVVLLEGEELRIAAARNIDQETLRRGSEQFSKSLAHQVIASGHSLLSLDAQQDEQLGHIASVHLMKLRSVICAPIRIWGSIAGAIYLDNRFRPGAFQRAQVELLEGFGVQAGIALDTARLLQHERQQRVELLRAKTDVEALSARLEEAMRRQTLDLEQAHLQLQAQRRELSKGEPVAGMVGSSLPFRRVLELIHKTADTEIPVYIFGESGTGKELVARAIHQLSPRRDGPLVTVNCGGLSPQLLASELFGHVRGAFTGAVRDHAGLIRTAEGGTLFLDEVSEMSPELQVQLLRVLQTGDYHPVGGSRELRADVRVISASNLDLEQAVLRARFRQDLFYRLNVLRIVLPPLRERREDIPLLCARFLDGRHIHRTALTLLLEYSWPGNVRELQNELLRASALAGEQILPDDLSPKITSLAAESPGPPVPAGNLGQRVADTERRAISEALEQCQGNLSQAARQLGLSRGGLYKKLRAFGLDTRARRSGKSKCLPR